MTVTPPAAAGAAGNGPAGASPAAPAKKKKPIVAIIAVVALLVAGVGGFFLWKTLNPGPPLPTAPTETLVKYVLSPKFMEAPADKKPQYLGALENREDEVEKLFRSGKLSEPQMAMAREGAWLGKNLGRMEKFFSLPPGQQRLDSIKKVVDKIDDVDEPPKTKGPAEEKLPKRDKKWGKQVIASLPADVQAQWKEFQKAINDEQDRRKKEKKAAEKAGAATKPATNASKSGPG
jgi:hypothetical protein